MNRRFVSINNWVTGRYFDSSHVDAFFRSLTYFRKKGIKIHPSVRVSAPTKSRKTPDVFMCSGVSQKNARERIDDGKLLLLYDWNECNTPTYELVGEDIILRCLKNKNGKNELAEIVINHILQITEGNVELRNIR